MFCALKAVKFDERQPINSVFGGHFRDRLSPEGMLLVSLVSAEEEYTKFIWICDEVDPQALSLGFVQVEKDILPKQATFLIGHNATFEKLFEYEVPPPKSDPLEREPTRSAPYLHRSIASS